jgi:hypothetical protein
MTGWEANTGRPPRGPALTQPPTSEVFMFGIGVIELVILAVIAVVILGGIATAIVIATGKR